MATGFEYGSLDLILYTHTKPHAHTALITTAWLSSLEPNRENGCVFTLSAVSSPDGPVEQASGSLICCQSAVSLTSHLPGDALQGRGLRTLFFI